MQENTHKIQVFKITDNSGEYGPIFVNDQRMLEDTLEILTATEVLGDYADDYQCTISVVWMSEEEFNALEPFEF